MPRSIKRTADGSASPDFSPWARVNSGMEDYSIGFSTRVHSGVTGTYTVQVTLGNPEEFFKATYSRTTTTLTITYVDHGLNAGDGVNIQGTDWDNVDGQTLEVATVPDADTFTVTVANSGATAGSLRLALLPIDDLASFTAVSGNQTGSTTGAIQMIRLAKNGGSLDGKVTLQVTQSYGS